MCSATPSDFREVRLKTSPKIAPLPRTCSHRHFNTFGSYESSGKECRLCALYLLVDACASPILLSTSCSRARLISQPLG
eukprot:5778669-Pleurochrysis_carterae.AAC.5